MLSWGGDLKFSNVEENVKDSDLLEAIYLDGVSYIFLHDDTFDVKDVSSRDQIKEDKEEFDNERYTSEHLTVEDVEINEDSSDLTGEHTIQRSSLNLELVTK